VVHSHSILAFFDSGTSHCLILDSSSASHSILICIDAPRRIGTWSGVVITYIIRLTVSLQRSVGMKQCYRFRTSARQSYGNFSFYYSSNDLDFFYQVHGTRVLSEWSAVRLLFKRLHSGLVSVRMISWSCSQSHQLLGSLYRFGGPRAPLASPSEGHVLDTHEPNQVWASLHPGA